MNHFQTVAVFTYPTDLFVAKSFLESHEIECFVRDEMTIQVHNFYSNAIGGIKLEVNTEDYEKARCLLIQHGFIEEEEIAAESENNWIFKLDKITSTVPVIKSLSFSTRAIILFILVLLLITIPAYFLSLPTTKELLTNAPWCLSHVTYNGKNYVPTSSHIRFILNSQCEESINFKENGLIELPGFQSQPIMGQWQMEEDSLRIFGSDNFEYIYNGNYKLDFNGRELTITSGNTILYCYR
ncbi:putative signal transducing protein [Aequorivita antarctica]|uniref:DUF2007 domain-containing protein n=1 Tax=Aequorivita antarctica TaxID=153266 RepID=A0A5C6YZM5_9FLAO|nr:DUF2007 domain-containing protein [Aequorivita antarctica]TXD72559.1 DUF2007 domain-containing protein [Aequorivita antarctica]SRX75344.1 hypothetical protein AEQU3_02338 [Aequorivita antarctica]